MKTAEDIVSEITGIHVWMGSHPLLTYEQTLQAMEEYAAQFKSEVNVQPLYRPVEGQAIPCKRILHGLSVGDEIEVLGMLKTKIERIDFKEELYWFLDEDGKEWNANHSDIEKL